MPLLRKFSAARLAVSKEVKVAVMASILHLECYELPRGSAHLK